MTLQQLVEELVRWVRELQQTPTWETVWVGEDPGMEMINEEAIEAGIDRDGLGRISTEQPHRQRSIDLPEGRGPIGPGQ
jgi:hypothetical protein